MNPETKINLTLTGLVQKRLWDTPEISECLTTYQSKPAVFFQSAPSDKSKLWRPGNQYPRISFTVDMQADAERGTSGMMVLDIWCEESGIMPEYIEPLVRDAICGVFFTPKDGGISYCMEWERSDSFEIREKDTNQPTKVLGITMIFGIFAFPTQISSDPDPVLAMNEYMKKIIPDCRIIAYDNLPEIYAPTAEQPAFYWRFGSMGYDKVSWAVAWVTGTITGHIFAPSTDDRLKWLKVAAQNIASDEEAMMLDDSPMFFKRLKADNAADYLRVGQISVDVWYGVLRKKKRTVPELNIKHF